MDKSTGLGDAQATRSVRVEIYNHSYHIRGDGDPAYISQLADFVDRRMREVAASTVTVDTLKVAMLAALHIADELHQLRNRYEQMDHEVAAKTSHLSDLIDEVLFPKREGPVSLLDVAEDGSNAS